MKKLINNLSFLGKIVCFVSFLLICQLLGVVNVSRFNQNQVFSLSVWVSTDLFLHGLFFFFFRLAANTNICEHTIFITPTSSHISHLLEFKQFAYPPYLWICAVVFFRSANINIIIYTNKEIKTIFQDKV